MPEGFPDLEKAWKSATKLRKWAEETRVKTEDSLRTKMTDEFKTEYKENNPSSAAIDKLNEEQKNTVEERVKNKLRDEMDKKFKNVMGKTKLLLLFTTNTPNQKISLDGIVSEVRDSVWTDWTPKAARHDAANDVDLDA